MAMSIFHRVTGVALYLGTLLIVWWLVALAAGPGPYATVQWVMTSFLGRIVLIGYTWALFHHMLGGFRHFLWDFGLCFEREARMNLARFTLFGSLALTVVLWAIALTLS
jgi:succinate dehydrogenase / fumarate reductase, cytochrome b subunit